MTSRKEVELLLPELGEGVIEATITNWLCEEGRRVEEDESIVEVATDKVDSEIPTPTSGIVKKILVAVGEVVKIGQPIAILEIDITAQRENESESIGKNGEIERKQLEEKDSQPSSGVEKISDKKEVPPLDTEKEKNQAALGISPLERARDKVEINNALYIKDIFLSPLVKSICEKENITAEEISEIKGTGKEGRITKHDMFAYLQQRNTSVLKSSFEKGAEISAPSSPAVTAHEKIPMSRTRKFIADHMVLSKETAVHVTSFVEADLTRVVKWRDKHKTFFEKEKGFKLTFLPIIIQAVVKALKDYPMINVSVEGDYIIKKNYINIGVATALPTGELMVPVLKNADKYSLVGLAEELHKLVEKTRTAKLNPEDVMGGTYTVSNIGTFGNILGTPIINQPQSAILAVGSIEKKPAVIETELGDMIGIRSKMFLSHSYDHRVIDGLLGGSFVKRVAENLENFDTHQEM